MKKSDSSSAFFHSYGLTPLRTVVHRGQEIKKNRLFDGCQAVWIPAFAGMTVQGGMKVQGGMTVQGESDGAGRE